MLEMDQIVECKQLRASGHGIREIARKLGVARNTVRGYLRGAQEPGVYSQKERRAQPVRDQLRPRVEELLREEQQAGVHRKQRLTAARVFRLLRDEGMPGSPRVVRSLVKEVKLSLRDPLKHAYLPLEYEPGKDAQVDFFEAEAEYENQGRVKVHVLLVRPCFSRRTFGYIAPNQTQEALLEGLMRSFEHFGGVFARLWFDNLTPAVQKVLKGRDRVVQKTFQRFAAHYGFEACFCSPGKGNEKGGVEGAVKYSRHEIFSPLPRVQKRSDIQALCDAWMKREDDRVPVGSSASIGALFELEQPLLIPLPRKRFAAGKMRTAQVTPRSWVSYGTNVYSVPVAWVGHEVDVRVEAERVTIRRNQEPPVIHERLHGRREMSLELAHYLPLLQRKHRGLDHAVPMRRWMEAAAPCWEELLAALRKREGQVSGGRLFIEALMMCEAYGTEAVERAVKLTLRHPEVSVPTIRYYLWKRREEGQASPKKIDLAGPIVQSSDPAAYMDLCRKAEAQNG